MQTGGFQRHSGDFVGLCLHSTNVVFAGLDKEALEQDLAELRLFDTCTWRKDMLGAVPAGPSPQQTRPLQAPSPSQQQNPTSAARSGRVLYPEPRTQESILVRRRGWMARGAADKSQQHLMT